MEVRVTDDLEKQLATLSETTGRAPNDLVKEALAGYFGELARVRDLLDRRFDDLDSGRVTPVDADDALARLKTRINQHRSPT